jgi:hypothetical protein
MLRIALAFAAFVGSLAPAFAAPPNPVPKVDPNPKTLEVSAEELSKARELVRKLGSETYTDREDAERQLAAMGRLARPALLTGVNLDPDPEIRARCNTLLPKANAEELKARLDAFMADTDSKYEHDLPGWHQLRAVVRGEFKMFGWTHTVRPTADKAARELFLEFIKAPGGQKFLAAFAGPPEDLGRMVAARKQDMYNAKFGRVLGVTPRNPGAIEIVMLLFGESQVNARYIPRTTNVSLTYSLVQQSSLPSLLNGTDEKAQAMQAVVGAWFDSRTEPMDQYYALILANNGVMRNDAAASRLAGRLLASPGLQGAYKTQAFTTITRLKAVDQIPALEKSFTDQNVLSTTIKVVNGMNVRQSVEVRDAALAVAVILTGQDPADYGFDAFPKNVGLSFSATWAKIPEEKRKAAFEKWAAWKEKNP